jgi:hypothetical protein
MRVSVESWNKFGVRARQKLASELGSMINLVRKEIWLMIFSD